jgi:hypothetical protein
LETVNSGYFAHVCARRAHTCAHVWPGGPHVRAQPRGPTKRAVFTCNRPVLVIFMEYGNNMLAEIVPKWCFLFVKNIGII